MNTKVLGIDPGSQATGYGLVEAGPGTLRALDAGTLRPKAGLDLADRLQMIYRGVVEVIHRHQPDVLAVETAFFHKHPRSALVLGHVRGVILLAGREAGLPVHEYAPREIKMATTGQGGAGKEQVAFMIQGMLGLRALPSTDASDALAVAVCHWHRSRVPLAP